MTYFPPPLSQSRRISALTSEGMGVVIGSFDEIHEEVPWSTSNLALYVPIVIRIPTPLTGFYWLMNTTANVDVGLYSSAGTRLVSAGSTAGSGVDTYQEFDVADMIVGPGRYYIGTACDNGAGQVGGVSLAAIYLRMMGVKQEASAFPLPATATFATPAGTLLPSAGFKSVSTA